jgi:hypothetical protein
VPNGPVAWTAAANPESVGVGSQAFSPRSQYLVVAEYVGQTVKQQRATVVKELAEVLKAQANVAGDVVPLHERLPGLFALVQLLECLPQFRLLPIEHPELLRGLSFLREPFRFRRAVEDGRNVGHELCKRILLGRLNILQHTECVELFDEPRLSCVGQSLRRQQATAAMNFGRPFRPQTRRPLRRR